jgi:hypothetical protein
MSISSGRQRFPELVGKRAKPLAPPPGGDHVPAGARELAGPLASPIPAVAPVMRIVFVIGPPALPARVWRRPALRACKPDRFRHGGEIRLIGFEEPDQRRQKHPARRPAPKLIRPDSGQVKEPPRAPFVGKCRGEREKRNGVRVGWRRLYHRLKHARTGCGD